MMKAVGYCRVSTIDQGESGVSLAAQEERLKLWAAANGYDLAATFIEVMSGGRAANRPELQKALALACRSKAVLVVYSLSRLARSVKDAIAISEQLERAGANLASISERIDSTSAMGKMVFQLLSTLSEFEKNQVGERTRMAMQHLRRSNRRISIKIPLGYDLAPDGQTLVVNAGEQRTIERIRRWRDEGMSLEAIAHALKAAGVKTKLGRSWYASTIKAILDRHKKLAA